jgi:hypothetical protein
VEEPSVPFFPYTLRRRLEREAFIARTLSRLASVGRFPTRSIILSWASYDPKVPENISGKMSKLEQIASPPENSLGEV